MCRMHTSTEHKTRDYATLSVRAPGMQPMYLLPLQVVGAPIHWCQGLRVHDSRRQRLPQIARLLLWLQLTS